VVGAGIFGLTGALELQKRGHHVTVLDGGMIPNPLAASTDISKVIRFEYGPDETYMMLMERAREGWLEWHDAWGAAGRGPLYHETGVIMMSQAPLEPAGFEYESHHLLN
jgi:glycine/D-amino acid oxidase-like deaminating enzyme